MYHNSLCISCWDCNHFNQPRTSASTYDLIFCERFGKVKSIASVNHRTYYGKTDTKKITFWAFFIFNQNLLFLNPRRLKQLILNKSCQEVSSTYNYLMGKRWNKVPDLYKHGHNLWYCLCINEFVLESSLVNVVLPMNTLRQTQIYDN